MKTKVIKNQLFGKLVIGLLGVFMLFVLSGCEKEKSVTGPTASNTSESSISNAAIAQSNISTSRTFSMDQYKNYKGTMYVTIDPSQGACDNRSTAKIIWGPWQTKEVHLNYSKIGDPMGIRATAIKFKKTQKNSSVPLTVVVDGCDESIYYYINLYKGKPPKGYYIEYTPDWIRR